MEKETKKRVLSSPFMGRSDGVVFEGQFFKSEDIVEYTEVAEVKKTGEGKHDFVIVKSIVPTSTTNRADFINSFSGDVGIMNVLKKVVAGGETIEDVVNSGRFASKQKDLVDLSHLPDNIADAYRKVEEGVKAFDNLPNDIKKKQSFAHFAESFSKDDFQKYKDAALLTSLILPNSIGAIGILNVLF